MEKFSVIIPAYNRHPLTAKHVEYSMASDRVPDEIVVVNDGGDPSLRDMVFGLSRNTEVIYARIEQDILWNYNGAVNLGVWLSTGDVIAIEDTDHIPDKTIYRSSLQHLVDHPETDRICFSRKCVDVSEVMAKPMEDWTVTKTWGCNQMVTILRRDVYLRLKGQDERFAGAYGWMTYDWVNRYRNILKINSAKIGWFWAVIDGGEPGLKRNMSMDNHRIYRENAFHEHPQHPKGILNFTYTYERWPPTSQ